MIDIPEINTNSNTNSSFSNSSFKPDLPRSEEICISLDLPKKIRVFLLANYNTSIHDNRVKFGLVCLFIFVFLSFKRNFSTLDPNIKEDLKKILNKHLEKFDEKLHKELSLYIEESINKDLREDKNNYKLPVEKPFYRKNFFRKSKWASVNGILTIFHGPLTDTFVQKSVHWALLWLTVRDPKAEFWDGEGDFYTEQYRKKRSTQLLIAAFFTVYIFYVVGIIFVFFVLISVLKILFKLTPQAYGVGFVYLFAVCIVLKLLLSFISYKFPFLKDPTAYKLTPAEFKKHKRIKKQISLDKKSIERSKKNIARHEKEIIRYQQKLVILTEQAQRSNETNQEQRNLVKEIRSWVLSTFLAKLQDGSIPFPTNVITNLTANLYASLLSNFNNPTKKRKTRRENSFRGGSGVILQALYLKGQTVIIRLRPSEIYLKVADFTEYFRGLTPQVKAKMDWEFLVQKSNSSFNVEKLKKIIKKHLIEIMMILAILRIVFGNPIPSNHFNQEYCFGELPKPSIERVLSSVTHSPRQNHVVGPKLTKSDLVQKNYAIRNMEELNYVLNSSQVAEQPIFATIQKNSETMEKQISKSQQQIETRKRNHEIRLSEQTNNISKMNEKRYAKDPSLRYEFDDREILTSNSDLNTRTEIRIKNEQPNDNLDKKKQKS